MNSRKIKKVMITKPFILIKTMHPEKIQEIKIPIPNSIENLEKNIIKNLILKNSNLNFYDSNGIKIEEINQLVPGSTIICSTIDSNEKKIEKKSIIDTRTLLFGPLENLNKNLGFEEDELSSSDYNTNDELEDFVVLKTKTSYQRKIVENDEIIDKKFISDVSDLKSENSETIPTFSKIPTRKLGSNNNKIKELDYLQHDELDDLLNSSYSEFNFQFENQKNEFLNEYFEYEEDFEEENLENMNSEQIIEIKPINKLNENFSFPNSIFNDLITAMKERNLSNSENFIESQNIEEIQNLDFIKKLINLINEQFPINNEIEFQEELELKSQEFIENHRIYNNNGTNYCFQSSIIGPKSSGKSVYLNFISKSLIYDIIICDQKKKYFIYPLNLSNISSVEDHISLFKFIIQYSFQLLRIQYPLMINWYNILINSFNSIISSNGSVGLNSKFISQCPYRDIVSNLVQLYDKMRFIYKSHDNFNSWIELICEFPYNLSKSFGFHNIIFILDHLDSLNFPITETLPFSNLLNINPIDIFLKNLPLCQYLISFNQETFLFNLINSNYLPNIETVTLIDFINIINDNKEIIVEFEDQNIKKISLNIYYTGGIPYYLNLWNKLNLMFDELEEIELNSDEYDDLNNEIITLIEIFIILIIKFEDKNSNFTISNFFRKKKK